MCVCCLAVLRDSRYHICMTTVLVPEIFIGLLAGLVVAVLVVLILQLRNQGQLTKLTYPAYEYALQQAEHDANQVLKEAQKQAREIITKAETTARADIAKQQEAIENANEVYRQELEQLHASMSSHLEEMKQTGTTLLKDANEEIAKQIKEQSDQLQNFADTTRSEWKNLITHTSQTLDEQSASAKDTVESLLKQTHVALEDAQTKQRQALESHMVTLMDEAKTEVAQYTKARQGLLDEHIAEIVAAVTREVLHTSLDDADHTKLAKEALMKAKQENLL